MQMYHLVVQYRMTERCASIRNVNYPAAQPELSQRPPDPGRTRPAPCRAARRTMLEAARAGNRSPPSRKTAPTSSCSAVSAAFWMQPLLQKKLMEIGWDVPVLEGRPLRHRGSPRRWSISASMRAGSPSPASVPAKMAGARRSF